MKKYPMYYNGVKQTYPNVAPGQPIFSRAVKVGGLIFIGPKAGRTLTSTWGKMEISDNVEKQVEVSLDKIRLTLEEAGSSMNNIIKTIMYIKNIEDIPRIRKAELEYYQKYAPLLAEEPPVRNVTQLVSMAHPIFKEEIGAIAVESGDRPGWEMKKYPMYYGDVKQTYPNVTPVMPTISRSAVVGNLIFISDMDGRSLETGESLSDNVEDQMSVALDKIRFALEETGSSMNNIIKIVMYLKNLEDTPLIRKAELEYYQKHAPFLVEEPPISGILQPVTLSKPDNLIEIEAMAVVDRDRPGWEMKKYPKYYDGVKQAYTSSVIVGDLIFCSGVNPLSPETGEIQSNIFEEQMNVCFDKLRLALEKAGGSMNNMCRVVMCMKNMENTPACVRQS